MIPRPIRAAVACPLVPLFLLSTGPAEAQDEPFTPVTDAVLQDPDPADWLSWRRTLDGWGYSPLAEVSRDNVGDLQLAWSWGLEPGVSQTTPVVHDGVMYIANPGNVVQALDAATGDFLWEYRREMDERLRPAAQLRSLAIYEDLIILNTVDAHIVGLDARTGEVRWDTDVAPDHDGYGFSSGPVIADGTVVAGLRGCERFRDDTCYIVGVDGRTGRLVWRTSTIARPGERGGDTWGDLPLLFRAGSDAWIPGSYDPVNRLVYYGTAQAKPWSRDARGTDGDALYSDSTLALDPDTGEMQWFFQHIPGDSHDMDETFERILIDYDGKQSVFSMGKLAILWELDRATGAFVNAVDLGYQNLADVNRETGEFTYREGMVSAVGEELFFCPSTGGFKSLRAMSYHPDTGALYVPLNLQCETAAFGPVERRAGGGGTGGVRGRLNHFHPGRARRARRVPGPRHPDRGDALEAPPPRALQHGSAHDGGRARLHRRLGALRPRLRRRERRAALAEPPDDDGQRLSDHLRGRRQAVRRLRRRRPRSAARAGRASSRPDLIPEMRNPRAGNAVFVFALP